MNKTSGLSFLRLGSYVFSCLCAAICVLCCHLTTAMHSTVDFASTAKTASITVTGKEAPSSGANFSGENRFSCI